MNYEQTAVPEYVYGSNPKLSCLCVKDDFENENPVDKDEDDFETVVSKNSKKRAAAAARSLKERNEQANSSKSRPTAAHPSPNSLEGSKTGYQKSSSASLKALQDSPLKAL